MTPKEKANELVLEYLKVKTHQMFNGWWHKMTAKQCALIAVDEILKLNHPYVIVYESFEDNVIENMTQEYYWKEVKTEIEKL
jgi:hypothetical protein